MATKNDPKRRPNPRAEARRAAERRRRLLLLGAGIAAVLLAVVIALATTLGDDDDRLSVSDVARDVEVTGDGLPRFDGEAAQDPAVGTSAPAIEGASFEGAPREVGGDGPQLITFMASWCPACQQELPVLADWLEQDRLPDEVDLVAVATSLDAGRPNWPPQDWFDEVGYPGPVMVDDAESSTAEAFGLSGTPFWVAVDGDGQVVWRTSGMIPIDELDALVAELAES